MEIDAQELVTQMTTNYANTLAEKDQQIANLQVTVRTLQSKLDQIKTHPNGGVIDDNHTAA